MLIMSSQLSFFRVIFSNDYKHRLGCASLQDILTFAFTKCGYVQSIIILFQPLQVKNIIAKAGAKAGAKAVGV